MENKQNEVFIVNPRKKNMKIHIRNHVSADLWYTYVHTYNNYIQVKKEFYEEVISI